MDSKDIENYNNDIEIKSILISSDIENYNNEVEIKQYNPILSISSGILTILLGVVTIVFTVINSYSNCSSYILLLITGVAYINLGINIILIYCGILNYNRRSIYTYKMVLCYVLFIISISAIFLNTTIAIATIESCRKNTVEFVINLILFIYMFILALVHMYTTNLLKYLYYDIRYHIT